MHHGRGTNRRALAAMRFGFTPHAARHGHQVVPYVLNRFLTTGACPADAVEPTALLRWFGFYNFGYLQVNNQSYLYEQKKTRFVRVC